MAPSTVKLPSGNRPQPSANPTLTPKNQLSPRTCHSNMAMPLVQLSSQPTLCHNLLVLMLAMMQLLLPLYLCLSKQIPVSLHPLKKLHRQLPSSSSSRELWHKMFGSIRQQPCQEMLIWLNRQGRASRGLPVRWTPGQWTMHLLLTVEQRCCKPACTDLCGLSRCIGGSAAGELCHCDRQHCRRYFWLQNQM